jgi:molecular chaperone DnaK
LASDNATLGVFRLEGIPAAPRGIPQIEVAFDIDANGILNVSAMDKATGKSQQITITASTNLTENDVERMVSEAKLNEVEDERRRGLIDARNAADHIIYQTEKSLSGLNGQAPATLRQDLENKIAQLKESVSSEDETRIRQLSQEVQQASMAIGQASYQSSGDSSNGQSDNGAGMQSEDEDIIEGEFENA